MKRPHGVAIRSVGRVASESEPQTKGLGFFRAFGAGLLTGVIFRLMI